MKYGRIHGIIATMALVAARGNGFGSNVFHISAVSPLPTMTNFLKRDSGQKRSGGSSRKTARYKREKNRARLGKRKR